MKPLVTNHRVLTWLCVCPPEEPINWRRKLVYTSLVSTIFIACVTITITSAVFFNKTVSNDLEASLFSLSQVFGYSGMTYLIIVAFVFRRQITGIFSSLQRIYTENKHKESFQYVAKANEKSEWMWKIYSNYIMGAFCINTLSLCAIEIIFYWIKYGELNTQFFYLPHKTISPWNQGSVFGYAIELFFQILNVEGYFIFNGSFLLLFISMCWHHQAFYKMFQHSVDQLNHRDKDRNDHKHLVELIRFHVSIKEWFSESAEVYSFIVLNSLICNTMVLACAIFQLDLQIKYPSHSIAIMAMAGTVNMCYIFLYCYFGKLATESYEKIVNCLYESNWQDLSIGLKKYLIIMMADAQRPLYFHGFGFAILKLETFTGLLKSVYFYYMMFKTLTE